MAAAPPVLPKCPSCLGGGSVHPFPSVAAVEAASAPYAPCASCKGTGHKRLKVALRVGTPGQCYWNILWSGIPGGIPAAPMRAGVFPKHHPVVMASGGRRGADTPDGQIAAGDLMDELRALGYWASCFPEGDGITFQPNDPTRLPEQVALDFEQVFGWSVRR